MEGAAQISAAVAFLVAAALIPLLIRFAIKRNLLDVPNARSSHEVPTPRLGGLAVIAGVWAGALLGMDLPILIAATLAGGVGFLDDLLNPPFWLKAAGQMGIAAGLLLLAPPPLMAGASGLLIPLAFVLGLLWVMALVNAFNFMDGIDGIAGGTAILNALFLGAFAGAAAGGIAAFIGAVAGFLVWNFSPARIFLGDSGSHFLGFFLAAVALYANSPGVGVLFDFVLAALVFTPFLFDTGYTLVRRAGANKNVFAAHREHIYQRVASDPAKHRQVSIIYYGFAALAGLGVLLAVSGTPERVLAGGALIMACCIGLALLPRVLNGGDNAGKGF